MSAADGSSQQVASPGRPSRKPGGEDIESRSGLSWAGGWGADPQSKIVKRSECPALLVEWRPGPMLSRELKHRILTLIFGEPRELSHEDEIPKEAQRNA